MEAIEKEIDNKIIIVYGRMGSGKTQLGILMGIMDFPERIYGNVEIFNEKEKQINKPINSKKSIENIRFSYTPGLIIIDEGGINANARRAMTNINVFLNEVIVLSRKKNCSMVFISQTFESLDANIRRNANLIIKMQKVRTGDTPYFIIKIQKQYKNKLLTIRQIKIKSIQILKTQKIKYNTLESSKIDF